ncbi:MAG: hypothetical protein U0939_15185 [Pirellulales bacterium]
MNHVRSILSALLTVVGMCVATLIAPVPLWAQGQQTLTRVFFVDESKQSLQWAELIAGEKPTMTSVREISGFPKLDPQKQAISSLQAVGGMMLVGIRTLDDADAPAGWLLIESGAYEEAHGDHSHWIYPYAPRIRAAQFDEQTRGPDRVAVIDGAFYWSNVGADGFYRLDPSQIGPREPAQAVRQRAAWHTGGGESGVVSSVGNVVAFTAWKNVEGDGAGRIDVTALRPAGNDKTAFSFDLPSTGTHAAAACQGKVFFATKSSLHWVVVPSRISSSVEAVAVQSLGDPQTAALVEGPLEFATYGRYVVFSAGAGPDAMLCHLDAAAEIPQLRKISLPLPSDHRPGAVKLMRSRKGQPLALVFHAGPGDATGHDRLSVFEMDPDRNGNWSDAKLSQAVSVGKGRDDVPGGDHYLAIEADNRRAVYSNPGDGTLMVLNLEDRKTVTGFRVGGAPTKVLAIGGRVSNH